MIVEDKVTLYYKKNKCAVTEILFDVSEERNIKLKEEYNNIELTQLGCYSKDGKKVPFTIKLKSEELIKTYSHEVFFNSVKNSVCFYFDEIYFYKVDINLPKTISDCVYNCNTYTGYFKDEELKHGICIVPVLNFTVDNQNETFHANYGQLPRPVKGTGLAKGPIPL